MNSKIELYKEAYRRGLLPDDKKNIFDELVRRGKIDVSDISKKETTPPPQVNAFDKRIAQSQEFDKTGLGKTLNIAGKVISAPARALGITDSESYTERLQREKQTLIDQESRGLSSRQRLKEDLIEGGKEVIEGASRFAAFALPVGRGAKLAKLGKAKLGKAGEVVGKYASQASQAMGINAGSRFVEELAKGENIETSIQKAKESGVGAGAITLGLAGTGKGISYLANKLAPFTKKSVSAIQQGLTSIPKDRVEYAVNEELAGRSIFKGSFDPTRTFQSIGKRVQKAINYLDKEAGKAVGKEKELLKKTNIKLNTNPIIDKIDNMVNEKSFQGVTSLDNKDIKLINQFKEQLKSNDLVHVGKLNVIKNKINNSLSKTAYDPQTVRKMSSEGEGILKETAKEINEYISEAVPSYAQANQKFSKIRTIRDRVKTKLKDENVARNVKNIYNKDEFTQQLFFEIDELAPKGMKFQEKLRKAVVRNDYEQIAPGRGGGSGGGQGLLNLIRGGIVGGSVMSGSVPGALAMGAAVSPALGGKATVKALGAVPRIGRGLGRYSQPAIPLGSRYVGEGLIGNER